MIPAWYFLIPYGIIATLGFVFLLINLFHIARFGLQSVKTSFILFAYVAGFICVGLFSILTVFAYDWDGEIDTGQIFQGSITQQQILEL